MIRMQKQTDVLPEQTHETEKDSQAGSRIAPALTPIRENITFNLAGSLASLELGHVFWFSVV